MSKADESSLDCPVGETECAWLDEIKNLRHEIEQLQELVAADALTGLYNYRHFKTVLRAEMDRSKRSGVPTTLVMLDVDHFKVVNDNHGHEAGNQVLEQLAEILRRELRTTDIVARYGGDEFTIVFPETHLNLAIKVAERIRQGVEKMPFVVGDDTELQLTVSMGASVYMKTSVLDLEEFVESVDKYLYEAKDSGRNCICHIDYADLRKVTEIGADERALLFGSE
jgi:diguanylate cyclase (GGDEF)-like protein